MTQRRADLIAIELEEAILRGDHTDGDRLDETRLAAEFGVSRTPLREALQKLSITGLIEQIPRRGVFVRQPGTVELMELFETMAELEASCARLAASRISDDALRELRTTNENCHVSVLADDPDGYYASNEVFHRIIYRESGNRILERETLRFHQRLKPYRRLQLQSRGRLSQSMQEHEAVVVALMAGDSSLAADTLREHVAVQGEKLSQLMMSLKRRR